MRTGSPPISMTSASAAGRNGSGAVTPKLTPVSRSRSSGRPVNVMTGCRASGSAPRAVAASRTAVPYRPLVCAISRPASGASVAARPATRPGSASSGTVSRARSTAASSSGGRMTDAPGSKRPARSSDRSDTAEIATTWCPARSSAAPRTVPTRPAPITPTLSRAGRSAGSPIASAFLSLGSSRWPSPRVPERQRSAYPRAPQARAHGLAALRSGGARVGPVWTTWRAATQDALYGRDGFYARGERPAAHFRTSVHTSPRYAGAVLALLSHADAALGHPEQLDLVDIGASQGELLSQVLELAEHLPAGPGPAHPGLSFPQRIVPRAVEIAPQSSGGDDRIRWSAGLPDRIRGLVIASEWLDNIPVDVAELTPDGPRIMLVDPGSGAEQPGPPAGAAERDWLRRWWPLQHLGDRAELGQPRCAAWADVIGRLDGGPGPGGGDAH